MQLPPAITALRHRIDREVAAHFERHPPEQTVLLLDSTGPNITRQYIVLDAIGLDRLQAIGEIHAFSGAVYALFGFLAFATQRSRVSIDSLCQPGADRVFRDQHHPHRGSGLLALARLLLGRSAFTSTEPLVRSLDYTFGDFVQQPFSAFGDRIHVYLARSRDAPLAVLSNNARCSPDVRHLRDAPIRQVIALAANVPFVYGGQRGGAPFFDAVYTRGYGPTLKTIGAQGRPTLISTPWRGGVSGDRRFVNCHPAGNARWAMLRDFLRLVSGRRNHAWSRDIAAAFRFPR